jgi:hypothetical protein
MKVTITEQVTVYCSKCGECIHFGYNVMGECICNLKNGNKKASPYVGACYDNFTQKD